MFWAAGFVAARHGIDIGFTPADITFHRCFWAGVVLLPLAWRDGLARSQRHRLGPRHRADIPRRTGHRLRQLLGLPLVPLGHGGIIQPSTAALLGLLLSTVVLHERLPVRRAIGAVVIVAGLCVIGGEAITTIGVHGVAGDRLFVLAGAMFATFGMFLRKWRVPPLRAMVAVSVVSLVILPIYGIAVRLRAASIALGLWENLLQAVMQGLLAGPAAIYLFTRSVVLLGAGRAAVFPTLVPPCVLLIGWLALGIVPSLHAARRPRHRARSDSG